MKRSAYRCQAVVVGTGAGGAVAGAMLAEAGIDTILVEKGRYYQPADHADMVSGLARMYVHAGMTTTLGLPPIPLAVGETVGGTTAINSGTCFRAPTEKVAAWGGPTYEELVPYFEEVERRINAHPMDVGVLGGNWRVLKRGCDALGLDVKPLVRNARDCKGLGRCAFGCPGGAKQSTDLSFIPAAVAGGAQLLTEHRVEDVILQGDQVVGIAGTSPEGGFEIRAEAVVLSMGAISGPMFLLRHGLGNSSGLVGRGLRIHPASRVVAEFDEIIDGFIGVPQGAYVDRWADRGIMLEGIFTPPGLLIASLPGAGHSFKDLARRYRHMSAFGVMVADTSSGTVRRPLLGARFPVFYQINRADLENMRYGMARVAEIYLAAGAKRIYFNYLPVPAIKDEEGLRRLETVRIKRRHFGMMAFHPLGTCRMGADPRESIVNFALETHDLRNLYIMDGSVIPGSLGVNPQVTIMALAMRAARSLAERLK